ncbi:hypothetical protein HDU93_001937 [Gonapodya sp. JEL0774]|nr:hypothetical protein HDU93_001937 [Gonapodya sp. JEL0774]
MSPRTSHSFSRLFFARFVLPGRQDEQTYTPDVAAHTPKPQQTGNNGNSTAAVRPKPAELVRRRVEWKLLYELQHNWETGNATVVKLVPALLSSVHQGPTMEEMMQETGLEGYSDSVAESAEDLGTDGLSGSGWSEPSQKSPLSANYSSGVALFYKPSNPLLAFTSDLLFTASTMYNPPSKIMVWDSWTGECAGSFGGDRKTQATALSIDENYRTRIRSLRDGLQDLSAPINVAVGYADGSVAIFRVLADGSEGVLYCHYSVDTLSEGGKPIVSVAVCEHLVVACAEDFSLKVFRIWEVSGETASLQVAQRLKSAVAWEPVTVSLEADLQLDEGSYILTIAFAIPHHAGGWQPGVQQLELDMWGKCTRTNYYTPTSIPRGKMKSSGLVADWYDSDESDYEDGDKTETTETCPELPFRPVSDPLADDDLGSSSRSAVMSSIAYRKGYVVSGFADGNVRVYAFRDADKRDKWRDPRSLYHISTFPSHTSRVASVYPNPNLRKLVTGGLDGTCHVRVLPEVPWRQGKKKSFSVKNVDPCVGKQLSVVRDLQTDEATDKSGWTEGITSVGCDEGRIFGVCRRATVASGAIKAWNFFD